MVLHVSWDMATQPSLVTIKHCMVSLCSAGRLWQGAGVSSGYAKPSPSLAVHSILQGLALVLDPDSSLPSFLYCFETGSHYAIKVPRLGLNLPSSWPGSARIPGMYHHPWWPLTYFLSIYLPVLGLSYKWNHIVHGPFLSRCLHSLVCSLIYLLAHSFIL